MQGTNVEKGLYVTEVFIPEQKIFHKLPLLTARISAGFPSPGDDYIDQKLDLNEYLIKHPSSTFIMKVDGLCMINAGIYPGDLIVVDRSLEAANKDIVVAIIDGEFTVKRIRLIKNKVFLIAENSEYDSIEVTLEMKFQIWGVVTYVIHQAK